LLLLLLFMLFEVESSAVRLPCSDCSGGASEEQSALLTSPLQAQKLSVGTARAKPTAHIISLHNDLLCSKTVSSFRCVHLWICSLCVCVCMCVCVCVCVCAVGVCSIIQHMYFYD